MLFLEPSTVNDFLVKTDYFKESIRQYIEKCRHLEVEIIKRDQVI